MIRQLVGDCRVLLPTLEPGSVQSCITSIPYWGLRDYGTPPLVWGGDPEHAHEWVEHLRDVRQPPTSANSTLHPCPTKANMIERPNIAIRSGCCPCGAWLGSLGLEPTPELYVEHIVECFSHVRRVLADDGVLWLNIGDSYAGAGRGPTGHNGIGDQAKRQGFDRALQRIGPQEHTIGAGRVPGYKPKDLMEMPSLVALALREDGWYLRSRIPWLKRNAMPESVTDRPTTAVEYVFLLSKSARYFWNADAVRVSAGDNTHARGTGDGGPKMRTRETRRNGYEAISAGAVLLDRNRRNSDWFFESWQGLLADEDGEPLALVVNPQPFSGAHFATFPPRLVEPMIRASTREGDVVLDPFGGSGTVGLVADRHGRNAVLCELKPDYSSMAAARITADAPLFAQVDGGGRDAAD